MYKYQATGDAIRRLEGRPVKVSVAIQKHREPLTSRDIAEIVYEEYDSGQLKPQMAKRIASRTKISEEIAELLVEVIDVCYDYHSEEDWDGYGN